ncbi:hypothetical protein KRMM14A1259_17530 [Krasilnikovia sp. MM14-A1259]
MAWHAQITSPLSRSEAGNRSVEAGKLNRRRATVTVAGRTQQLIAWIFATLFVAGFPSAVRKT